MKHSSDSLGQEVERVGVRRSQKDYKNYMKKNFGGVINSLIVWIMALLSMIIFSCQNLPNYMLRFV